MPEQENYDLISEGFEPLHLDAIRPLREVMRDLVRNWKKAQFTYKEKNLQDPCVIPLDFLKAATCNFSKDHVVGRGSNGVVYMGILQNGMKIAVKKFLEEKADDEQFRNEVMCLVELDHKNVVQLVGICGQSNLRLPLIRGKYIMAERRKRLICFEYLDNKSLDTHISAQSCGLEWCVRYKIIKGVCSGLDYLHVKCNIVHLDLKPENILLDANFVPKIADFSLSRRFGQQQSQIITGSLQGTVGYMAPEYIDSGLITTKVDMFSFGVIIIMLVTGFRNYPDSSIEAFERFIENVTGKWMNRWEKAMGYIPLEYSQQVKRCIMIGLNCVNPDPKERPDARDIIKALNAI
ncbi:hypothetical protein EJB05_55492, partial [Eragrostis curvula]